MRFRVEFAKRELHTRTLDKTIDIELCYSIDIPIKIHCSLFNQLAWKYLRNKLDFVFREKVSRRRKAKVMMRFKTFSPKRRVEKLVVPLSARLYKLVMLR